MKLDKKMELYLKDAHIDFTAFRIIEAFPVGRGGAVVLLAPRENASHSYFNLQYRSHSAYYGSLEEMLDICVENEYISRREANRIVREYSN